VKVFGAYDWALRLLSMCCYAATLFFSLRLMQRAGRESAFVLFVVLLILMTNFGTWHMNAYIDPLMLALSVAALDAGLRGRAVVCGLLGALVLMTKGLATLAVGPPLLVALWLGSKQKRGGFVVSLAKSASACALTLLIYALLLHAGEAKDFLFNYWQAQGTRSQGLWAAFGLFRFEFWRVLLIQSLCLVLLVPLALRKRQPLGIALMAWAVSFVIMLSGVWRVGAQYFLPLMWVAALAASLVLSQLSLFKKMASTKMRVWLSAFLFVVFLVGQSPGLKIKHRSVPKDAPALKELAASAGCSDFLSEFDADWVGELAPLVWYSGIDLTKSLQQSNSGAGPRCVLTRHNQDLSHSSRAQGEYQKNILSDYALWILRQ
jgi:4-amino-4-deoxy-L-arabinose transferase-like glycosyltransferase